MESKPTTENGDGDEKSALAKEEGGEIKKEEDLPDIKVFIYLSPKMGS